MLCLGTYLIAALMIALGWWSVQLWIAERIVEASPSVEAYAEALKWDPSSDSYHAILGNSYRDLLEGQDLGQAVEHLRRAVELRPDVWTHHLNLAVTHEISGNFDAAEVSFQEALKLNPHRTLLHWQVANFYLRRQKIEEAAKEFRAAVELDPSRLSLAADRLDAMGMPLDRIASELVPDRRSDLLSFLYFVLSRDEGGLAWETWQAWEAAPPSESFQIRSVFRYIDHLLRSGELSQARRVWQAGLVEAGLAEAEIPNSGFRIPNSDPATSKSNANGPANRSSDQQAEANTNGASPEIRNAEFGIRNHGEAVFNSGFEMEPVGGGLDWVLPGHREVYYELDYVTRFEGLASLRIDFPGDQNLDYRGPRQVMILPAGPLQLEYVFKAEQITSDQGVHLEVYSYPENQLLVRSEPILGTRSWTRRAQEFVVDRPMAAYLTLRRYPSERFASLLGGSLWIDEVRIR